MPSRPGRTRPPQRRTRHVVVVGGGIAGLAAAWFLTRDGGGDIRVTVLESSPAIGGKLGVSGVAGLDVDTGAEAMLARRPEGVALAREVGLGDALVPAQTASAGVWSRGAVRPLPAGQVMGVPTGLRSLAASGVLSAAGLARVPLDLVLPATRAEDDVSVGRYVGARLGREVVERLVEPLLGGVYAGHADALSLEATVPQLAQVARRERSLLLGAREVRATRPASDEPVFVGLSGGLGRLPQAVADASGAEVRTKATVRALSRTADGWRLVVGSARRPERVDADAVVLALPATPASRLLSDTAPLAGAMLGELEYASVALVTLVYPASAPVRPLVGSGFLVPPVEGRLVKGATYLSRKWAWLGEAARGDLVVRCSVGRHGDEPALQMDDADLVAGVVDDLADIAGLDDEPRASRLTRWGGALPQYAVGHRSRVARVKAAVSAQPGLAVCGAAYDGVGVPACVASAHDAAARILTGFATSGGGEGH